MFVSREVKPSNGLPTGSQCCGTTHEAALDFCQEMLEETKDLEAKNYDVWAALAIRYGLRVVGLRSEFYKMAARDPTHAKMILPTLQQRNEVAASEDLTEV